MGPLAASGLVLRQRLPRVSGDGPQQAQASAAYAVAAPRERGWALELAAKMAGEWGCPA